MNTRYLAHYLEAGTTPPTPSTSSKKTLRVPAAGFCAVGTLAMAGNPPLQATEATSATEDDDDAEPVPDAQFAIVFLPDTQIYSQDYAATFAAQTQWIVDNRAALNIQMVLGGGDVIDDALAAQWANADAAIDILDTDGQVPYLLAIGNHDYNDVAARTTTDWQTYFGQARYTGQSWWDGGFYEAGHSENAYLLRTIEGVDYIFIVLEFGPRQKVLDWAAGLLTTYSDRQAIICTHSYMYRDNSRCGTGDEYNPHDYITDDVHDGDEMWTELVKLRDNIFWVQSAHDLGDGLGHRMDLGDGGNVVHQDLANYQLLASGGNGYLRVMTIKPGVRTVLMRTYSPTLGVYANDGANDFLVSY